jgi:hypothetical protein
MNNENLANVDIHSSSGWDLRSLKPFLELLEMITDSAGEAPRWTRYKC